MSTTTLYRYYNAGGDLIYVGVTSDVERRTREHSCSSPWFHEVTKTVTEPFATRAEALEMEKWIITTSAPRHNFRDSGSKSKRVEGAQTALVLGEIRGEMGRRFTTRKALSRATGIAGERLSRKLHGSAPMTLGEALAIADALGVSLTELIARAERRDAA